MATSTFSVRISINEFDEGRPGKRLDTILDTIQFVRQEFKVRASAKRVDDQVVLRVKGRVANVDAFKQLYLA